MSAHILLLPSSTYHIDVFCTYMFVYVYICIHVCIHVKMCVYAYMHIYSSALDSEVQVSFDAEMSRHSLLLSTYTYAGICK